MRKITFLVFTLFSFQSFGNFIIKYRSGHVEKSQIDPREMKTLAISSNGDEIEYVEKDVWLQKHDVYTNDPYYNQQWALINYMDYGFANAKTEVEDQEGIQVVVAVVDTGVTIHSELTGKTVPGYDFVSNSTNGRDGDGRDSDPSDPGDYGDSESGCNVNGFSSSWHGTHISGIIAAESNNGKGIAGSASSQVRIQPLRVLGPCGGQTSDIADAVRWAAGGKVTGLELNITPAKVINLSLGGRASCSQYMQEAIDFANSAGSIVVVSAGNESSSVDEMEFTPANCRGVFRVGALNTSMGLSDYSNYGKIIDIAAPGDIIYSLVNAGTYSPTYESYTTMSGTSMSAGFVSAAAAMIYSVNPGLYPDQVKDILVRTSESFSCSQGDCALGAISPYEAVRDAMREVADASFVYDDPVVIGGFGAQTATVKSTSSSSGGSCGTILYDDNSNFPGTFLVLIFGFVAANIYSLSKKKKVKLTL